jgi:hypothetical protein
VAKPFQEGIAAATAGEDTDASRAEISELGARLFNEDASNILMFYVYLTKELLLIGAILDKARAMFADEAQCDCDRDLRSLVHPSAVPN